MFRGGPEHLGSYTGPVPTLDSVSWKFLTRGRVISSPAVVGGLVTVLAAFIPSEWSPIIQAVLAAATAFSVYAFPNVTDDEPEHRAE